MASAALAQERQQQQHQVSRGARPRARGHGKGVDWGRRMRARTHPRATRMCAGVRAEARHPTAASYVYGRKRLRGTGIEANRTRWSACSLWCGRGGQQARGGSAAPEFAGEEAATEDEEGPDSFDVDRPDFNQWSRKKKRWSAHLPDKSAGRGGCRWPRDRAVHGGGCVREREGEEQSSGEKLGFVKGVRGVL